MAKIRVLVARVGREPVIEEIDDSVAGMQALVGGSFEAVSIAPCIDVWCNEDGLGLGLAPNHGYLGDIFLSRCDPTSGEQESMTDEDLRKGLAWLARHASDRHPGAGVEFFTGAAVDFHLAVAEVDAEDGEAEWNSL